MDLRVAKLLETYGATGTFYVSPKQQFGLQMLSQKEVQELSRKHEIGAHTLTHPHLTNITLDDAKKEIVDSKKWVEDNTGKPCTMFCYPYGDTNPDIESSVKAAGFLGARTVDQFAFSGENPHALPISLLVYPYPLRPVMNRKILNPFLRARPHLKKMHIPMYKCHSWLSFAKNLFMHAYSSHQPWFHILGHSSELEKYHLWDDLESFLKYVATFDDVIHAPNSALLDS